MLVISDNNLGILYMLAMSSLSTYGILLAGWSANSKYAFLGSKWPNKNENFYLKQTISEKFIGHILLPLLGTLCITPYFLVFYIKRVFSFLIFSIKPIKNMVVYLLKIKKFRGSKVKILIKMNNPQVTKASNSWVGTSEAIRLLSIYYPWKNLFFNLITSTQTFKSYRFYKSANHLQRPEGIAKRFKSSFCEQNKKLNPKYVTGFTNAEAAFLISVKKSYGKYSWGPKFAIKLNVKDLYLLKQINKFFCSLGKVINKLERSAEFNVQSYDVLTNILIPHFIKYPLITQKLADFILFKSNMKNINKSEHRTKEGIKKIVTLKAYINRSLLTSIKAYFLSITSIKIPTVKLAEKIDPDWMAGFTNGEGCFHLGIRKYKTTKSGFQVTFYFNFVQHLHDLELMKLFIKIFNCGQVNLNSVRSLLAFIISSSMGVIKKNIPLFNIYPQQGIKLADYTDFFKIAQLINLKAHLTSSGLDLISMLKSKMNRYRVQNIFPSLSTISEVETISPNIQEQNDLRSKLDGVVSTSKEGSLHKISTFIEKRNKSISKKRLNPIFCQWLAGLIDGDGGFYLTKKGYASLEIIMDIRDEHALQLIKNVYGGSVKLVSGNNALRYSLRHKQGFLALVKDVNGEIRNSYRLMQLNKICLKYGIVLIYPEKLKYENGWLSGFFDADGSVTLNSANGQLAITLTQKTNEILQPLIELYGGSIFIDRTTNTFKWYISNKQGILKLIEYFKKYPSRSLKKNRLHLIPKCYQLKEIGAHKALPVNSPLLAKSWKLFMVKWTKFDI